MKENQNILTQMQKPFIVVFATQIVIYKISCISNATTTFANLASETILSFISTNQEKYL